MKTKYSNSILFILLLGSFPLFCSSQTFTYKIVDTNQKDFYNHNASIEEPLTGNTFYGQDASYSGNQASYSNNNDGTITDKVTGLMWQQDPGEKITFSDAFNIADASTIGGYSDWRVPTIKELYSLILFSGVTGQSENNSTPYIHTDYFTQPFGDTNAGERFIDAQTWSATEYLSTTMNSDATVFGVNFIDGRIKGYPKYKPGSQTGKKMYCRLVRGNNEYGKNNFIDNEDETISDLATGLMWQQADDGNPRNWEDALSYAENLDLASYSDWRLPNAKELQSIVDYTRCPDITNSPAIDALFSTTEILDPDGNSGQYPYFWSSTTHLDGMKPESFAVYLAFGEAQGKMNNQLMDVHGAGAQRGDPKSGNANDYPSFFGPQGDVRYVYNYVRAVRDISDFTSTENIENLPTINVYPNPVKDRLNVYFASENYEKYTIELIDLTGRKHKLMNEKINSNLNSYSTSHLKAGIYILCLKSSGFSSAKKIVKQ